jgi:hypothetical protein
MSISWKIEDHEISKWEYDKDHHWCALKSSNESLFSLCNEIRALKPKTSFLQPNQVHCWLLELGGRKIEFLVNLPAVSCIRWRSRTDLCRNGFFLFSTFFFAIQFPAQSHPLHTSHPAPTLALPFHFAILSFSSPVFQTDLSTHHPNSTHSSPHSSNRIALYPDY